MSISLLHRNNKAQNSTISAVIAIVLAVALVVFLIWGFATNWTLFRATSTAYSGTTTLDSLRQACELQCSNGLSAEYCTVEKEVIDAEGATSYVTCYDFMESYDGCQNPRVVC